MTTALKNFNTNLMLAVCTCIVVGAIGWVGHTTGTTHDDVIMLKGDAKRTTDDIAAIKATMLTRDNLTVELLKVQKADKK